MCGARMSNIAGSDEAARTIIYRRVPRVKYNPRQKMEQPKGDYPNAVVHALERDRDLYFQSSLLADQLMEIREKNGQLQERVSELELANEKFQEEHIIDRHHIHHLECMLNEVINERDNLQKDKEHMYKELKSAYLDCGKAERERDHYRDYYKKAEKVANDLFEVVEDEQLYAQQPRFGVTASSSSHTPLNH